MSSPEEFDKNRTKVRNDEVDNKLMEEAEENLQKARENNETGSFVEVNNAVQYLAEIGEDLKWGEKEFRILAVDMMNMAQGKSEVPDRIGFNDYTYEKIISDKSKEIKYLIVALYKNQRIISDNSHTISQLVKEVEKLREKAESENKVTEEIKTLVTEIHDSLEQDRQSLKKDLTLLQEGISLLKNKATPYLQGQNQKTQMSDDEKEALREIISTVENESIKILEGIAAAANFNYDASRHIAGELNAYIGHVPAKDNHLFDGKADNDTRGGGYMARRKNRRIYKPVSADQWRYDFERPDSHKETIARILMAVYLYKFDYTYSGDTDYAAVMKLDREIVIEALEASNYDKYKEWNNFDFYNPTKEQKAWAEEKMQDTKFMREFVDRALMNFDQHIREGYYKQHYVIPNRFLSGCQGRLRYAKKQYEDGIHTYEDFETKHVDTMARSLADWKKRGLIQ